MALELEESVDTLEGVDESLHSLYVEEGGKFIFKIPEKQDTSMLELTLKKERDIAKEAKSRLKEVEDKYKDVDLEVVAELRKKAEILEAERVKVEEQKLLDDNNADQVWANRTEKLNSEWQKKVDIETAKTAKEHEINTILKRRALQGEISLGIGDTFHEYGKRDAIRVASELFTLDDKGRAVMMEQGVDGSMTIVIGKDGKSPFSPKEWALSDDVRAQNPHWFNATGGGSGMVQGKAGATLGGARSITRSQYESMKPDVQAKAIRDGFKVVDG